MAKDLVANSYEEARQRRLEENKKRFEELSILKISKTLSDKSKSGNTPQRRNVKLKTTDIVEPRRSLRAKNPVSSYREDNIEIDLPSFRKRSRSGSICASYLARPVDEVRLASYEERTRAFQVAQELQSSLESQNPSFVKSMVRSHVYSCFWLGLPAGFCADHLPKTSVFDMVLEDEDGNEYEASYLGNRTGLSGGWRAFALEHKLDDGDALVFELVDPARFKIYITRVSGQLRIVSQKSEEIREVRKGYQKKQKQVKQQPRLEMKPSLKTNGVYVPDPERTEENTCQNQRRSNRLNKRK